MKKIMVATLGLSLLSGSAMLFAQDSSKMDDSSKSMDNGGKKKKKSKKKKSDQGTMDNSTAAPKQ